MTETNERARRIRAAITGMAGALAVLALAVCADALYASHGLTATWRAKADGERIVVDRTIEHRVQFPNEHRALSRYVQAWPFERLDVPERIPRVDARLEGWLHVPAGPDRIVRVQSPNRARLYIDGGPAKRMPPLPPGRHYIELHWWGQVERKAGLRLLWGEPGPEGAGESTELDLTSVPRTALTPATGSWPPLRQALWLLAPLLAIALGLGLTLAFGAMHERTRRHRFAVIGAAVIVALGLGWRLWDYAAMPEFSENPDELFATWNGWQLLHDGTTRGWSLWPAWYGERVEHQPFPYFRERPYHIIRPYFEHPPAMHLLVGAAAHLGGAEHWSHARLTHTRLVPIGLGMVSLIMVMLIARRVFPRDGTWWVAGLLYAAIPVIALQERVIKEESLMVPLALVGVWLFLRWRDEGEHKRHLVAASMLAGACALAKAPGIFYAAALVMLIAAQKRMRAAIWAAGIAVAVASLFFVYGAVLDWELFWSTTVHQATGRPAHWNLYPRFFEDPGINHNLVGFGWLLFLWLGYLGTVVRPGGQGMNVLVLPPIVYIAALGLSSGNWTFGWYFLNLYPFLCIGAGRFVIDMWQRPGLLRGFLFVGLLVMYTMNFMFDPEWVRNGANQPEMRTLVTLFLLAFLAPYALSHAIPAAPTRWLARAATVAGFIVFIVASGSFVARYDHIYEQYRNFDRIKYFNR